MPSTSFGPAEAEALVLGLILSEDRYMEKALLFMKRCRARDFSCRAHFLIFKVMRYLHKREKLIFLGTVVDRLSEMGVLDEVGEFYLIDLSVRASKSSETLDDALSRIDQHRVAEAPVEVAATHFDGSPAVDWMAYDKYIETSSWKLLRRIKIEQARSRCQVCYSKNDLDVHHRTYDRLGHESLDDLTVLCRTCHALYHDKGRMIRNPARVSTRELASHKALKAS